LGVKKRTIRSKEAAMKISKTTALIGLIFLLAAVPLLSGSQEDPEALINRARSVIQDPHFSRDAITNSLSDALGAALLILPDTADYAADFKARIETVRKMFDNKELFSDKGRQYLGLAYQMVNGGKSWQLPEELKASDANRGIERASEICQSLLDSAQAELKAGQKEKAVRLLLEYVILVITPVEA
jgi:hypothetical protein